MKAIAVAPGKIILIGEHFVVYGEPAIVMAVNRSVKVTVEEGEGYSLYISSDLGVSGTFIDGKYKAERGDIRDKKLLEPINIATQTALRATKEKRGLKIAVTSDIPMAVGLGSSGAVAVATVTAVGRFVGKEFSKEEIIALSLEAEKFVHVHPSGVDQAISTYGGALIYEKAKITHLNVEFPIPLVIGNTGIKRSTGQLVQDVRWRRRKYPEIINPLIHTMYSVSQKSIGALNTGSLNTLGELMDINHGLLVALGVSHAALDKLVYAAKRAGALGAKLTGGGGGGCMIALSTLEKREKIADAIHKAGGTPMIVENADKGVQCWITK